MWPDLIGRPWMSLGEWCEASDGATWRTRQVERRRCASRAYGKPNRRSVWFTRHSKGRRSSIKAVGSDLDPMA
ncbi:hypothetical protein V6N13_082462 [Hibiscus sabdariffa]